MVKYLSGRVKRTPQDQLKNDRYEYINLEQTEPNLADPPTDSNDIPPGSRFQLISIPGHPGRRYWVPIGGGLTEGAITVFDEGTQVSGFSSVTQFNFVGAAVTSSVKVQSPSGHPGIAATVTVIPVTVGTEPPNIPQPNTGELWWESDTGDLYVYYDDGDSSQWVMANAGGQGQKGQKGEKGAIDEKGNKGDQGIQGIQGVQGVQGDKAGLEYKFSSQTNMTDPGQGFLKFSNATIGSVNAIAIDATNLDGIDFSDFINSFDSVTSTIKGHISVSSSINADTTYSTFDITDITDNGGWLQLTVQNPNGSAPTNNEQVVINISRTGDKGQKGQTGDQGIQGIQGIQGVQGDKSGLRYQFLSDTTTPLTDPGDGKFRFNNANIASIAQIAIDNLTKEGTNVSSFINSWDDSTDTIKGYFILNSNVNDDNSNVTFEITAVSQQSGFFIITVQNGVGILPSNEEECVINFSKTGDKGEKGIQGTASITNNADNRIITGSDTTAQLNAEQFFTFDANNLLTIKKSSTTADNSDFLSIRKSDNTELMTISKLGGIKDKDGELGTSGQLLSSTGSQLNWVDDQNTTYDLATADGAVASEEKIELTGTDSTTDPVILKVGNGLSIARDSDGKIVFTNTDTGSSSNNTFLGLSDTPADFTADANKRIKVNQLASPNQANGDALIFVDDTFLQLNDTPSNFTGDANKRVKVNQLASPNETNGDALIFVDDSFLQLNDTPADYTNSTDFVVVVNGTGNGLSFVSRATVAGTVDTTYSISASQKDDGTSPGNPETDIDPFIFLDASTGTDTHIQLKGSNSAKVERNANDEITISSTTYTLDTDNGGDTTEEKLILSVSGGGDSTGNEVVFAVGSGLSIQRTAAADGNPSKITFTNTDTGSSSNNTFLGLTDSPADFTGDANKLVAVNAGDGTDGSALTFIDEKIYSSFAGGSDSTDFGNGTATINLRESVGGTSSDDTVTISAGSNIQITSTSASGFTISAKDTNTQIANTNTEYLLKALQTGSTPDNNDPKISLETTGGTEADFIELVGTTGSITVTRNNDGKITFDGTTYDLEVIEHDSSTGSGTGNDTIIRLNPSSGTNDDVRLIAGSNVTLAHSTTDDTITISSTNTEGPNTTYTLPVSGSDTTGGAGNYGSGEAILTLTGTNSINDTVKIKAGSNINLDIDSSSGEFTISAKDTNTEGPNTTYDLLAVQTGSPANNTDPAIRLDPSDSSGNDDIQLIGVSHSGITVTKGTNTAGDDTINFGTSLQLLARQSTSGSDADPNLDLMGSASVALNTVNFEGGSNVTITRNSSGNKITISADNDDTETFLGLTDTPANYTGHANKLVAVNNGNGTNGTELTFIDASTVGEDNYANSLSFSSGTLTVGRTGSLADLTVDISGNNTNTKYELETATSGSDIKLKLDASTGTSDDEEITITAGTNITLTDNGSGTGFTIAASGTLTGTIDKANQILVNTDNGDAFHNIVFVDSITTGQHQTLKMDDENHRLQWNPDSEILKSYRNQSYQVVDFASGSTGSAGQVLTSQGNSAAWTWETPSSFPSGTRMLFQQTAAPTGWTKVTSGVDNRALRIVTGPVSSGGSNSFTGALNSSITTGSGSVSSHTLTANQIPSHFHYAFRSGNHGQLRNGTNMSANNYPGSGTGAGNLYESYNINSSSSESNVGRTSSTPSSTTGHSHGFTNPSFNLNVSYTDVIIAQKD